MKTVLIHGYVDDRVRTECEAMLGTDVQYVGAYQEGGYMLTLASDTVVATQADADAYLGAIYAAEEDIPKIRPDINAPVLVGVLPEPIWLATEDGDEFLFMGGVWGVDEDGGRYQE